MPRGARIGVYAEEEISVSTGIDKMVVLNAARRQREKSRIVFAAMNPHSGETSRRPG